MLRWESFWTASARGVSGVVGGPPWEGDGVVRMWGGRRCVQREKSGAGNTVRAFTRMLVVGSSRVRCGLNWYLRGERGGVVSGFVGWRGGWGGAGGGERRREGVQIELISKHQAPSRESDVR